MKKYAFLLMTALLTISLSVSAQNRPRQQRRSDSGRPQREMSMTAKSRAERMSSYLELSAEQQAKVEALLEKQDAKRVEQREAMKAKREKALADRDKERAEMRSLREKEVEDFNSELESIIGKEKSDKWNAYQKEQWSKRRNSRRR